MAKSKRFQVSLSHVAELKWIREWMERDVPTRLTTSQVLDAVLSIVHRLGNSSRVAVIDKDVLYNEMYAKWAEATAKALGAVLARFVSGEVKVRIMDGGQSLVITRLSDGTTETIEGLHPEAAESMARAAAGLGKNTTGALHVN